MAKLYGEIAAKALLTLDKSFARANGQPLDASEVYYSKAAAEEYAATAQAYIGQKIVVIENGIVTHYSVEDTAGTLKELGAKPVADGTTIAIGADGKITLANIAEANKTGTYNAVLVNGTLTWVKPSEITVEGLSDLIQALTGRVDTAESNIATLQEEVNNIYDTIGSLDSDEGPTGMAKAIDDLEKAVGKEGKPESAEGAGDGVAATGLFKAIEDEEARAIAAETALGERIDGLGNLASLGLDVNEKILTINEDSKALKTVLSLNYDSTNKKLQLLGNGSGLVSEIDATDFIKDGMIQSAELTTQGPENAEGNWLKLTFNTDAGKEDIYLDISELIDVYTAGNGLDLTGSEFSVKLASDSESFLTITADGVKLSGVQAAINEVKEYVDGTFKNGINESINGLNGRVEALEGIDHTLYATKEELTTHANTAAQTYATKDYVGTIPTEYEETNVIAYVNKKAEEVLSQATGDSSESVASVKAQLETYKSENAPKFEKLEGIETGAQVNVIESVVAAENAKISVSTNTAEKKVTIDDKALVDLITAAQNSANDANTAAGNAQTTANEAKQAASDNATAIGTLNSTVAGHTTTIGEHTTKIGALEQADIAHKTEYETLSSIVSGHTASIATKAEQTAVDAVVAKASANESAIKTLNETTIPGINTEIGKKADASALDNYYTKTQVGSIAEGKTLVQMIEEAASNAEYDDTAVRGLIGDNKSAIEAIYKVDGETKSGVLVTEISRVEGLVSAETTRATGVEADFETRIAKMETFWEAADDPNETIDKLAEIVAYIESDKSGALDMAGDIQANSDAIKAIYTAAEGDTPASGVLVTEIARVEGKADANTSAIAAINNETTGILALAKEYTDTQIGNIPSATAETLGLVKVDDVTIKSEAGVIGVKAVSTDLLVQGVEELILNGGTALK